MTNHKKIPTILREELPLPLKVIRDTPHPKESPDYTIHRYLRKNDITVDSTNSEVIEFLKGKHILITGATGFLGKLLVEKLLRCCKNEIGGIYVLIRGKKGKSAEQRAQEFLDHEIFLRLSRIFPDYKKKVIGLEGDMQLSGLGLSEQSRQILVDQINIIYHIAATVRFHEKLKLATNINIRGTKEIIQLAKDCKNLVAFVHMSTAFSNCNKKVIEEKFYEPVIPPDDLIKLTEILDENVLDRITPQLIGDLPNTYTFTKQIAEAVLKTEALGLPVCLHRPSIVFPTYREPVVAWSDNLFGPIGIFTGGGLGVLHSMKAKGENIADVVPADYVINSFIVSSYKTAMDRNLTSIPVYNYVSSPQSPVTWDSLNIVSSKYGKSINSVKSVYEGFVLYTRSELTFKILNVFLHRIPATIIDFIAKVMGNKPQLNKVYDKFENFISVLENFTTNQWDWKNQNTQQLWKTINKTDQEIFPFDMKDFDWEDLLAVFFMGVREFIVRDYLDTFEASKARAKMLKLTHYLITSLISFAVLWIVWTILSVIFSVILY